LVQGEDEVLSLRSLTAAHFVAVHFGRTWQILLQKSLAFLLNSDSVALMRFAMEAIDDGAAQARPRRVFLFVSA